MSDFDKEAERERLREKYEGETEDREQTRRMSQLLLQGATMTNRHCDACGSPIFRHDGQEFCPECHEETADAATDDDPETAADSVEGADDGTATADPQPPEPTGSQPQEPVQQGAGGRGSETPAVTPDESRRPGDEKSSGTRETDYRSGVDADVDEARGSLVRTLTTMARRAEDTDDPRRAKELLGAAREAAEAVAALDR